VGKSSAFRSGVYLLLFFALSGCGGGGHSATPSVPQAAATVAPQQKTATLSLVLKVPTTQSSSTRRYPKYISTSAKGVRLITTLPTTQDFAITPGSSNCPLVAGSYQCTFSQTFPAKVQFSLTVQIYDTAPSPTTIPASALLLASGVLANVLIPNGVDTVAVTMDGIPTTIETVVTGTPTILPLGGSGSIVVTPLVRDASGAVIIGSAPYANAAGAATPISLSIPASIAGYTLAVEPSGASTYGAAGTTGTLVEPGDLVMVTGSGGSAVAGVTIGAKQTSSSLLGVLRVPVSTTGVTPVELACCQYAPTVEAVPFDQQFPSNAPGQGVLWGNQGAGNGTIFYNPGRAGGTSYSCGALNTVDVGMAPGFAGVFNVGSNGGYYYFYAVSSAGFPACSGPPYAQPLIAGISPNNSFTDFCPTTNNCYYNTGEGGWGYVYIDAQSTVAGNYPSDGIAQAAYTVGGTYTAGSVTGYTAHLFPAGSGVSGIAVLPGRAVVSLLGRPGIGVDYAVQNQIVDGGNLATGLGQGGLSSPVALPDGTVYAVTSSGNLARCHIDPNPNVMTGQSCDSTIFATLSPSAYSGRARILVLGPDGALWYATGTTSVGRYDLTTGANTSLSISINTISVASGNDGRLYATDTNSIWSWP
jgi:hypothetical protein